MQINEFCKYIYFVLVHNTNRLLDSKTLDTHYFSVCTFYANFEPHRSASAVFIVSQ